jgi:DNA-binding NtrC family response regulator
MTICIPPLRDRAEEISGLADFFRIRFMEQFRRDVPELSEELSALLRSYRWPGNVLELENVIKRYVVGGNEHQLTQELRGRAERHDALLPETPDTLQAIGQRAALRAEMAIILETLERVEWNRAEAARQLRVSYKTLLNKLRKAGITGRRSARRFP